VELDVTKQLRECSGGDDTVQMNDGVQKVKTKGPSANIGLHLLWYSMQNCST